MIADDFHERERSIGIEALCRHRRVVADIAATQLGRASLRDVDDPLLRLQALVEMLVTREHDVDAICQEQRFDDFLEIELEDDRLRIFRVGMFAGAKEAVRGDFLVPFAGDRVGRVIAGLVRRRNVIAAGDDLSDRFRGRFDVVEDILFERFFVLSLVLGVHH